MICKLRDKDIMDSHNPLKKKKKKAEKGGESRSPSLKSGWLNLQQSMRYHSCRASIKRSIIMEGVLLLDERSVCWC